MALRVVANTVQAATASVSGTSTGSSGYSSGYSSGGYGASSGNTNTSASTTSAASSSSGAGFSTSSSPSMSDQFASASVQTNTVLSMSSDTGAVNNVSVISTPMPTLDDSPQVVMAEVQVQDMQGEIDTAVSGVMTASEADEIADKIISQNIKEQQQEQQQQQETTGQYADETSLVAYLGYVPGFDTYREATMPKAETWYEPKAIYTDAYLADNIQGFYTLAGTSLNTLSEMIDLQPEL